MITIPFVVTIESFEVDPLNAFLRFHATLPIPGEPEATGPHSFNLPFDALADRQTVYGLADRRAAVDALLRECVKTAYHLPDGDEHAEPRINRLGGLLSPATVSFVIPPEIEGQLQRALAEVVR